MEKEKSLEELQFEYEERAAIKEFLGNMTREEAERQAHEEVFGRKPGKPEQLKFHPQGR